MISKNKAKLIRSLESKKGREKSGLFVAEGPKVVKELLLANYIPYLILLEEGDSTFKDICPTNATMQISAEELKKLSFLQHPQGVIGIFQKKESLPFPIHEKQLFLALDGIQDPGNLGTIIRIADWFGIENIFCSTDTVDCWSPKVIQASMGSIARVNLSYGCLEKLITTLPSDFPVYGTLLDGDNIYQKSLSTYGLVIMGNEGNGISPNIRKLIKHKLLIPNYPQGRSTAVSLNVAIATALVCEEFRIRL